MHSSFGGSASNKFGPHPLPQQRCDAPAISVPRAGQPRHPPLWHATLTDHTPAARKPARPSPQPLTELPYPKPSQSAHNAQNQPYPCLPIQTTRKPRHSPIRMPHEAHPPPEPSHTIPAPPPRSHPAQPFLIEEPQARCPPTSPAARQNQPTGIIFFEDCTDLPQSPPKAHETNGTNAQKDSKAGMHP